MMRKILSILCILAICFLNQGATISFVQPSIPAQVPGGISFDATDDYVLSTTLGNFGANCDNKQTYLSVWFKGLETDVDTTPLSAYSTNDYQNAFQPVIDYGDDQIRFYGRVGNGTLRRHYLIVTDVAIGIGDGEWHNVIWHLDYSDTSNSEMFLDGVSVSFTDSSSSGFPDGFSSSNYTHNFNVAARNYLGTAESFGGGILAELSLYQSDSDWIQDDIDTLSTQTVGTPLSFKTSDLLIYYPMDDGDIDTSADGDTITDYSGNGYNGTGVDGANDSGLTYVESIES